MTPSAEIPIGPFGGGVNKMSNPALLSEGQGQVVKNATVLDGVLRSIVLPATLLNNLTTDDITALYRFGTGETSSDFFGFTGVSYSGIIYDKPARSQAVFFYSSKENSNAVITRATTGSSYELTQPAPAAPTAVSTSNTAYFDGIYEYIVQYELNSGQNKLLTPPSLPVEVDANNFQPVITLAGTAESPDLVDRVFLYRRAQGVQENFHLVADRYASTFSPYTDAMSNDDAVNQPTLQYEGYDCLPGPQGAWPGDGGVIKLPTPATGSAGNVTMSHPAYVVTLYKTVNGVKRETSPSPIYQVASSLTSKKVVFTFTELIPNGYSGARLYNQDNLSKWRLVDDQTAGNVLTHDTDDSSYTTVTNPYLTTGFDWIVQHKSMLVGGHGENIFWSEPGMPSLWKFNNWFARAGYPTRKGISLGNQVLIFTSGPCYRLDLSNPDSAFLEEIPGSQVTLYRTAVSGNRGVFVVKDGLSLYDGVQFQNISQGKVKESDFPADGFGVYHDGHYYCFSPTLPGIVANVRTDDVIFREITQLARSAFSDPVNGKLYITTSNDVYVYPDEEAQAGSTVALTFTSPLFVPHGYEYQKDFSRFTIRYQGTGRITWYVNGVSVGVYPLAIQSGMFDYSTYMPRGSIGSTIHYTIDNFSVDGTTPNSLAVFPGGSLTATKRGRR